MAEIIRMPGVLAGVTEAAIQTWLVQPGATVTTGQTIAEIETEKASIELPAEMDGIIGRLLIGEGETVAVGDPIAAILLSGEGDDAVDQALRDAGVDSGASTGAPQPAAADPAAPEPAAAPTEVPLAGEDVPEAEPEVQREPADEVAAPAQPAPQAAPAQSSAPTPADDHGGRRFVSPIVRRLAAQSGVDLSLLTGTGPEGRIVRRDLERHLETQQAPAPAAAPAESTPAAAPVAAAAPSIPAQAPAAVEAVSSSTEYEDIPLDRMRKAIARRLTESKSTVPHFYLVADVRMDALLALRAQINQSPPPKVSVNDFVVKAVAAALVDVPEANAIWNGDSIRRFRSVDVSVAVATDGGLMTPVVRGVERTSLGELSRTVVDLAGRAREGRLRQQELEGGSFAVSNLGMYGTAQFSAILNPPQSGILAVGAARKAPVVDENGELAVATVMTVTLSADHRVLDGAVAAQWLSAFTKRIENPLSILV